MGSKLGSLGPLSITREIGFADFAAVWDGAAQAGFVPVYAPSDGDSIETVSVKSLTVAFDSAFVGLPHTEGDGSSPTVGDQLGGTGWDLTNVDSPGTGISYVVVDRADQAIADGGRFWPVVVTDASLSGAVGVTLINTNPDDPDPPAVGSVTIEVVYRPAP